MKQIKLKVNDGGKAICFKCSKITSITYKMKHMPVKNKTIHILVGVCDMCDSVISIPAQETDKIKKACK